ncbi:DUF7096 domain-containing protein [Halosimplex amylolyticum]|uniref:DUF7096 domain-containing protein n=1 Tax=Halosimplex amylolyticum TaxID=3396616 RepID=UPI003F566235
MPRNRPVLLALLVAALVLAPVTHVAGAAVAPAPAASTAVSGPSATGLIAHPASGSAEPASLPAPDEPLAATDGTFATDRLQPNTSNYLGIREEAVERTGHDRASLNIAGAIQQDVTELRSEYASLSFERRYENTTGYDARLDVLRSEVDRLDRRVQQLELRRNRVIDDYNDGDLNTEAFYRELAAIDASARDVESQFDRIRRAAGLSLPSDLNTKMKNLEGDLLTLRGPVREQISQAMTGARGPIPVYSVTSQTGLVLASTQGSLYYREAYLGQNREQIGSNQFVTDGDPSGVSTANNRAAQLYPWAYDNIRSGPNVEPIGNTSVYYVQLGHPHGSLETYLDGRSESAFREFQTKPLAALPTRSTTNASDGLLLRINRSHATGPMHLTVTDNETGEPLDATVTINGDDVGSTGDDGRLWTLTPHQAVRISVTTDDGRTVTERFFAN